MSDGHIIALQSSTEAVPRNRIKETNSTNFNFNLNINSSPTFGRHEHSDPKLRSSRIPAFSTLNKLITTNPTSSIATPFYTTLPQPRPAVTCPSTTPHKYDQKYPQEINALYTTSPTNEIRGPVRVVDPSSHLPLRL